MSTFVSIVANPWQYRNTNIPKRDLAAVLNVAPSFLGRGIDVFEAARQLCHLGFITQEHFRNLLARLRACGINQRLNLILLEILIVTSFEDLVSFIRTMKQYDIAAELWEKRYGDRVYIVQGADIGVSFDILKYYSRTKCLMDDGIFKDRKLELERRFNDLRESFAMIDDLEKKSYAVHIFAVVTFLRLPHYREKEKRISILNEMKASIPSDVDPTFSKIVYYAKMASTLAYAGETDRVEMFMQRAKLLANSCKQTFVKVFVHHDEQKSNRIIWSNHPNNEYVKHTALSGQLGLSVLFDFSGDTGMIWRKVFLTESAMSLLKITNTYDILYSEKINEQDRGSAQELINALESSTSGNECRREMVKCLCKARIHEADDIMLAQAYAEEARQLALGGSYFPHELNNITRYSTFINENTQKKQLSEY